MVKIISFPLVHCVVFFVWNFSHDVNGVRSSISEAVASGSAIENEESFSDGRAKRTAAFLVPFEEAESINEHHKSKRCWKARPVKAVRVLLDPGETENENYIGTESVQGTGKNVNDLYDDKKRFVRSEDDEEYEGSWESNESWEENLSNKVPLLKIVPIKNSRKNLNEFLGLRPEDEDDTSSNFSADENPEHAILRNIKNHLQSEDYNVLALVGKRAAHSSPKKRDKYICYCRRSDCANGNCRKMTYKPCSTCKYSRPGFVGKMNSNFPKDRQSYFENRGPQARDERMPLKIQYPVTKDQFIEYPMNNVRLLNNPGAFTPSKNSLNKIGCKNIQQNPVLNRGDQRFQFKHGNPKIFSQNPSNSVKPMEQYGISHIPVYTKSGIENGISMPKIPTNGYSQGSGIRNANEYRYGYYKPAQNWYYPLVGNRANPGTNKQNHRPNTQNFINPYQNYKGLVGAAVPFTNQRVFWSDDARQIGFNRPSGMLAQAHPQPQHFRAPFKPPNYQKTSDSSSVQTSTQLFGGNNHRTENLEEGDSRYDFNTGGYDVSTEYNLGFSESLNNKIDELRENTSEMSSYEDRTEEDLNRYKKVDENLNDVEEEDDVDYTGVDNETEKYKSPVTYSEKVLGRKKNPGTQERMNTLNPIKSENTNEYTIPGAVETHGTFTDNPNYDDVRDHSIEEISVTEQLEQPPNERPYWDEKNNTQKTTDLENKAKFVGSEKSRSDDYSDIQVITNGYFTSKAYDEFGEIEGDGIPVTGSENHDLIQHQENAHRGNSNNEVSYGEPSKNHVVSGLRNENFMMKADATIYDDYIEDRNSSSLNALHPVSADLENPSIIPQNQFLDDDVTGIVPGTARSSSEEISSNEDNSFADIQQDHKIIEHAKGSTENEDLENSNDGKYSAIASAGLNEPNYIKSDGIIQSTKNQEPSSIEVVGKQDTNSEKYELTDNYELDSSSEEDTPVPNENYLKEVNNNLLSSPGDENDLEKHSQMQPIEHNIDAPYSEDSSMEYSMEEGSDQLVGNTENDNYVQDHEEDDYYTRVNHENENSPTRYFSPHDRVLEYIKKHSQNLVADIDPRIQKPPIHDPTVTREEIHHTKHSPDEADEQDFQGSNSASESDEILTKPFHDAEDRYDTRDVNSYEPTAVDSNMSQVLPRKKDGILIQDTLYEVPNNKQVPDFGEYNPETKSISFEETRDENSVGKLGGREGASNQQDFTAPSELLATNLARENDGKGSRDYEDYNDFGRYSLKADVNEGNERYEDVYDSSEEHYDADGNRASEDELEDYFDERKMIASEKHTGIATSGNLLGNIQHPGYSDHKKIEMTTKYETVQDSKEWENDFYTDEEDYRPAEPPRKSFTTNIPSYYDSAKTIGDFTPLGNSRGFNTGLNNEESGTTHSKNGLSSQDYKFADSTESSTSTEESVESCTHYSKDNSYTNEYTQDNKKDNAPSSPDKNPDQYSLLKMNRGINGFEKTPSNHYVGIEDHSMQLTTQYPQSNYADDQNEHSIQYGTEFKEENYSNLSDENFAARGESTGRYNPTESQPKSSAEIVTGSSSEDSDYYGTRVTQNVNDFYSTKHSDVGGKGRQYSDRMKNKFVGKSQLTGSRELITNLENEESEMTHLKNGLSSHDYKFADSTESSTSTEESAELSTHWCTENSSVNEYTGDDRKDSTASFPDKNPDEYSLLRMDRPNNIFEEIPLNQHVGIENHSMQPTAQYFKPNYAEDWNEHNVQRGVEFEENNYSNLSDENFAAYDESTERYNPTESQLKSSAEIVTGSSSEDSDYYRTRVTQNGNDFYSTKYSDVGEKGEQYPDRMKNEFVGKSQLTGSRELITNLKNEESEMTHLKNELSSHDYKFADSTESSTSTEESVESCTHYSKDNSYTNEYTQDNKKDNAPSSPDKNPDQYSLLKMNRGNNGFEKTPSNHYVGIEDHSMQLTTHYPKPNYADDQNEHSIQYGTEFKEENYSHLSDGNFAARGESTGRYNPTESQLKSSAEIVTGSSSEDSDYYRTRVTQNVNDFYSTKHSDVGEKGEQYPDRMKNEFVGKSQLTGSRELIKNLKNEESEMTHLKNGLASHDYKFADSTESSTSTEESAELSTHWCTENSSVNEYTGDDRKDSTASFPDKNPDEYSLLRMDRPNNIFEEIPLNQHVGIENHSMQPTAQYFKPNYAEDPNEHNIQRGVEFEEKNYSNLSDENFAAHDESTERYNPTESQLKSSAEIVTDGGSEDPNYYRTQNVEDIYSTKGGDIGETDGKDSGEINNVEFVGDLHSTGSRESSRDWKNDKSVMTHLKNGHSSHEYNYSDSTESSTSTEESSTHYSNVNSPANQYTHDIKKENAPSFPEKHPEENSLLKMHSEKNGFEKVPLNQYVGIENHSTQSTTQYPEPNYAEKQNEYRTQPGVEFKEENYLNLSDENSSAYGATQERYNPTESQLESSEDIVTGSSSEDSNYHRTQVTQNHDDFYSTKRIDVGERDGKDSGAMKNVAFVGDAQLIGSRKLIKNLKNEESEMTHLKNGLSSHDYKFAESTESSTSTEESAESSTHWFTENSSVNEYTGDEKKDSTASFPDKNPDEYSLLRMDRPNNIFEEIPLNQHVGIENHSMQPTAPYSKPNYAEDRNEHNVQRGVEFEENNYSNLSDQNFAAHDQSAERYNPTESQLKSSAEIVTGSSSEDSDYYRTRVTQNVNDLYSTKHSDVGEKGGQYSDRVKNEFVGKSQLTGSRELITNLKNEESEMTHLKNGLSSHDYKFADSTESSTSTEESADSSTHWFTENSSVNKYTRDDKKDSTPSYPDKNPDEYSLLKMNRENNGFEKTPSNHYVRIEDHSMQLTTQYPKPNYAEDQKEDSTQNGAEFKEENYSNLSDENFALHGETTGRYNPTESQLESSAKIVTGGCSKDSKDYRTLVTQNVNDLQPAKRIDIQEKDAKDFDGIESIELVGNSQFTGSLAKPTEVVDDPGYLGRLAPKKSTSDVKSFADLIDSDLYYIGDGVRLPLTIKKLKDGSFALSISDKICEQRLNKKCPCCVPREGKVLQERQSKENKEEEGSEESIEQTDFTGLHRRAISEDEKSAKIQHRNKRITRSISMPVDEFAEKYNLILNLNDPLPDQNVILGDAKSNDTLPHNSELIQRLKSINDVPENERAEVLLSILREIFAKEPTEVFRVINGIRQKLGGVKIADDEIEEARYGYQRDNPILERIKIIKELQKETTNRCEHKYQKDCDDAITQKTELLTLILYWLKNLVLSETN